MTTIALSLLTEVQDRLVAADVLTDTTRIRLNHLTPVTRDDAPTINVVPQEDIPSESTNSCRTRRELRFVVEVYVRSDTAWAEAAPLTDAVMAALDPNADPYPHNAELRAAAIRFPRPELADLDSVRLDMNFSFVYYAAPWTLDTDG